MKTRLTVLALVIVLVGCSQSSTPHPIGVTAPAPTYLPTYTPAPSATPAPPPLSMSQAWGNVPIRQFSLQFGNQTFLYSSQQPSGGLTTDDQVCGKIGTFTSPKTPIPAGPIQQSLALMSLRTGQITILRALPSNYQMVGCSFTDPWIIWAQGYGITFETLTSNWQIYALNMQTGELRLLDDGKMPNGLPPKNPQFSFPSASNGQVAYMSFLDNNGGAGAIVDNLQTQVKTGLGLHSSNPILAWPWLCWGDPSIPGLVFKNLQTQQQVTLKVTPWEVEMNDGEVLVTPSDGNTVWYYPAIVPDMAKTGILLDQSTSQNDRVGGIGLNDRLVEWLGVDPYRLLVFDRKLQRDVLISNNDSVYIPSDPGVVGHYLTWAAADPHHSNQFILNVIDTNTLP